MNIKELKRQRAGKAARMMAIATKESDLPEGEALPEADVSEYEALKIEIAALDGRISRLEEAIAAQAAAASAMEDEVEDTDEDGKGARPGVGKGFTNYGTAPLLKDRPEKGLVVGGIVKMLLAGGGSLSDAQLAAKSVYGERHAVTKALLAGVGASGGFMVPPDHAAEIIELLRANTVVRKAGPRMLTMPRGTMTLPRQSQAASAGYGSEVSSITQSEQKLDAIVATYKKLTALVPVSNDLLRYADPSADALVRDDLVQVMARREDLAFLRGDGTAGSPRGFNSFVQSGSVITTAGTSQANINTDLSAALSRLRTANVPISNPAWFMNPRTEVALYALLNAQGMYVYRDEMAQGKLFGIPYFSTTQIPTNLSDGTNSDCSELFLAEMTQALLLDSMQLELSVSREASYLDSTGATVNTFQQDQTLIRAISEHDFQMRHPEAIAKVNLIRWQ